MPIKPVSGEIKSQEINNNLSYLDSKIEQTRTGPIDTVTSVAQLNSKYPNGANGTVVVLEPDGETGFEYTWTDGAWKKGAIRQTQGILDKSISSEKLSESVENGTDLMVVGKNEGNFYNMENKMSYPGGTGGSDQVFFDVDEVETGKRYKIDCTEAFPGPSRPSFILEGRSENLNGSCTIEFDYDISSRCLLVIEPYDSSNNKITTIYKGIDENSNHFKEYIEAAGMDKIALQQILFNQNVSGKQHAYFWNFNIYDGYEAPSNLKLKIENLERRVSSVEEKNEMSCIIIDFDYTPENFNDLNISLTLDEYGFPFKFNAGALENMTNQMIVQSLVRRGCEVGTYFNDAAYLPTDEQLENDEMKTDSYVRRAVELQDSNGFNDQIVWSNRQFKTGVALKKSIEKYGYIYERLRGMNEFLPEKIEKGKLNTIKVSDNNTNWYQHTLDLIDASVNQGRSCAVFTHKVIGEDDNSGLNTSIETWRIILDRIRNYVDEGKAKVITYREYYRIFSE